MARGFSSALLLLSSPPGKSHGATAAAAVAMVLQWAEGEAQTGGVDAPVSTLWLLVRSCWAGLRHIGWETSMK